MLSNTSRRLTWLSAVLFAIVGLIFFFLPGYAAASFPWGVTPMLAMTIGGWSLGTAGVAWEAARDWRWPVVYPMLIYLWVFGVAETVVVIAFLDKLLVGNLLTWPYLAALAITMVGAVVGIAEWLRSRPSITPAPPERVTRIPLWARVLLLGFVTIVGVLAVGTALARPGGVSTEGGLFPEKMSLFTVRAFSAFFLAIVLAAGSLFLAKTMQAYLGLAQVGLYLIVPITVAGLLNLDKFDFAARPGGIIYLGAYIGTGLFALAILAYYRMRPEPTAES